MILRIVVYGPWPWLLSALVAGIELLQEIFAFCLKEEFVIEKSILRQDFAETSSMFGNDIAQSWWVSCCLLKLVQVWAIKDLACAESLSKLVSNETVDES